MEPLAGDVPSSKRFGYTNGLYGGGRALRLGGRRFGHHDLLWQAQETPGPFYGGLFEDGSDEAVDHLDALLGGADSAAAKVVEL
jgi:hypothetical protein